MSFWDDFFYIPEKERASQLWKSLERGTANLNLEGVSNSSTDAPPLLQSARRLPVEEISAVIQNRYRAFNVIDVNPYLLRSSDYAAQVPFDRIIAKVGFDNDKGVTGYSGFSGWRTIEIPFPGTFLKFEFSPTFINEYKPNNTLSNDLNYRKPTDQFATGGYDIISNISSRNVFVQFDDTNAPLIAVSHGDTFKIPFEKVYITCKVIVPRFSITTGYNAENTNSSASEEKAIACQPAFGPGYGLWENKGRHCVPFNFGLDGFLAQSTTVATIAPNNTTYYHMFDQGVTTGASNTLTGVLGYAHVWVTGISLSIANTNTSGVSQILFNVFRALNQSPTALQRQDLISIPIQLRPSDGTNEKEQNFRIDFVQPVRFTLYLGDGAQSQTDSLPVMGCMIISPVASSVNVNYSFSIQGYTYGNYAVANHPRSLPATTTMAFPLDVNLP